MSQQSTIVHYFDGRAHAEPIRLLLSHVGVPFEDDRIKDGTDVKELKKDTPLGQWPWLTIDGKKLAQTTAILRYLAHKHDLVGKTPFDDALVDMYGDAIQDGYAFLYGEFECSVFEKRFKETVIPYFKSTIGPIFEKVLAANKFGYVVGDKLTWVDIHTAEFFNKIVLHSQNAHILDEFPSIKAHNERILNLPNIKAWIEKRPTSLW